MTLDETALLNLIQSALLVFTRVAALMMLAPVLGSRMAPARIRLVLALLVTVLLLPLLQLQAPVFFSGAWWLAMFQQLLIGFGMGLVLLLVFEAVMLAGELIALGMGLSFAQAADPLRGVSTPVVGQFLMLIATLLFLAQGGHHSLLLALAQSFNAQPIGGPGLGAAALWALASSAGQLFAGGLSMALPITMAMLLVNLAFGVLSRAAPAINLMSVGFPLGMLTGLLLLGWTLPALPTLLAAQLQAAFTFISQWLGG